MAIRLACLGPLVNEQGEGHRMTRLAFYLLRIKARQQTRLVMRRYRVWSLDTVR